MDHDHFAVTERQMKRWELLRKVTEGKLTLAAVTPALGVCYRQAQRLKGRVMAQGLKGLSHGNRGRPPANKASQQLRQQVLELSQGRYRGFNDTHFCEELASVEGIVLGRETVRRWRREAGIRAKQRRRPPKHRRRRPRELAEGLMMLWDGSPHRWFGPESVPCCLMAAIDDATGKVLALRFVPHECAWAYLKLLQEIILRWGVPGSVYQDRHTIHKRADDFWSLEEELAGRQDPTQVGAALEALQITAICAESPQAKGRVERLFRTLQDRLAALLARDGIGDIAAANAYVGNGFIESFNRRFAQCPHRPEQAWRKAPSSPELERILSLCYPATVGNDNAVRLDGLTIDIPPGSKGRSYARQRVEVRQLLDGRWKVYFQRQAIAEAPASEPVELIRTKRKRKGVRGAYDAVYVNFASAPPRPCRQPPTAPGQETRVAPPTRAARRAGPGRRIGATRIA
jgi:transposase